RWASCSVASRARRGRCPDRVRKRHPPTEVDPVMTTSFAVTWDYRCPFARIGHLHVLAGLRDGADWDVTFTPFSLDQMHVEEGQPDVWDNPEKASALRPIEIGTLVRDRWPDRFAEVHTALFDARHV